MEFIANGSHLKYLGLALVLAWHYCLWFVPSAFPTVFLLADHITYGWMTALSCTVVTVVLIALALGRTRHLPHTSGLIWSIAVGGCVATLAVTLASGASPVVTYVGSAVVGVCAGFLWVMWGERYACQRAQFTAGRLAPTYGITLLVGLAAAFFLPTIASPVFVALMPLASGLLLDIGWRAGQGSTYPPMLPRKTTRQGTVRIVTVCGISFVAAFVSYFVVAIVPWSDLAWGLGPSFTGGVAIGAVLVLGIPLIQRFAPNKPTIFRLFPWLVFCTILACLLAAVRVSIDFGAFLLALAVSSVFEVLVIMYMARLTLSGYVPAATAFGMSAAAIRLGICLGNGSALLYEAHTLVMRDCVTPTLLLFVAILAGLLVPLVRQEYAINDLTHSPLDATEWVSTVSSIADQFRLSAREREILGLLGRGYTASAVAAKLVISTHTVNSHIQHIYEKMGIHKRAELLDYLNKR